jgi:formylglycine-generating enzyme required for sulfatase activity
MTPVTHFGPSANGYAKDYPAGAVQDPRGPDEGRRRVMRGGSWYQAVATTRSAARNHWGPTQPGGNEIGFRVVCVS